MAVTSIVTVSKGPTTADPTLRSLTNPVGVGAVVGSAVGVGVGGRVGIGGRLGVGVGEGVTGGQVVPTATLPPLTIAIS